MIGAGRLRIKQRLPAGYLIEWEEPGKDNVIMSIWTSRTLHILEGTARFTVMQCAATEIRMRIVAPKTVKIGSVTEHTKH